MNKEVKAPAGRFEAILNNIKEGYFEVDLKGNFTYFNETLCKLTGFSKDKLLGLNYKYLTDEEGKKKIFEGFNSVYKTGQPLTDFQYRFKDKHGKIVIGETSVYLKCDSKGKKVGFYGLFRDITKKKEDEKRIKEKLEKLVDKRTKELKELEEKYRPLAEESFLGIAIIQDNLTKYVNERLTETFGYSIDEIMSWQPGEFLKSIHPEDRKFVTEQVRKKQLGEPNTIDQYQFRGFKKNGEIIWLEVFSKTINYEGKPADFVTIIDITEKKLAEEKLKESEQQYRSTIDSIRDPIHVIDKDLKIILINNSIRKWLKILDIKEDIIGKKLNEVFTFLPKKVFHEYTQVFTTGKPIISEETNVIKDEIYYTESIKIPIFSEDLVIQVITIIRDISDHKLAQQKLKRSKRKYREAFNRSNFYKDLISHDINNILQNILSSIELSSIYLNEGKNTNELKRLLKISREQVSRGANLISNVRKLSELEEIEIITHPINAIDILNKSLEVLLKSHHEEEINIKTENPYKEIKVQGNELLTEVFENILNNAVKHNQNSPVEIRIKVSKLQKDEIEFIKFEFKDNGVGIPDTNKEIIFERAYKTDKSVSGMGIGLSLVKKIIESYDGQIWVENRVKGDYSKGSNFIVLIPEVKVK